VEVVAAEEMLQQAWAEMAAAERAMQMGLGMYPQEPSTRVVVVVAFGKTQLLALAALASSSFVTLAHNAVLAAL